MRESTLNMMKKFEQDHEVYVSANDMLTYWVVYARIPKEAGSDTHRTHNGIRYVTGPNEEGNVLVMRDAFRSDAYSAESWGPMGTIDDFVTKALAQILVEKDLAEKGQGGESCGTSCA